MNKDHKLLSIEELKTFFFTSSGITKAVDGVSYSLNAGETLGVVGESGSGKSVTVLSILRLIQSPPGCIVGGDIFFDGENLLEASESRMREIRGNRISMIFQEPMTSLNPVFTVGNQIGETLKLHQGLSSSAALERSIHMLRQVGIHSPEKRVHEYPHQLSGGMRQRVMIAMALACAPQILIADEPTTALDVTIQAQILELMRQLQKETGTAIILITHNLGIVAEMAQKVVVMYSGKVVESAPVDRIFHNPMHPYTKGLLDTTPRLNMSAGKDIRLPEIPGMIPSLYDLPTGCAFHPRCGYAVERCTHEIPDLKEISEGHQCRCLLAG